MKTDLSLNKMTIEEKISIMENIWDDLCKNSNNITSPDWHKNILEEREEQIKNNKAQFIDWETAKKIYVKIFNENKNSCFSKSGFNRRIPLLRKIS